eukprot:2367956-Rhodomonas_salina.1
MMTRMRLSVALRLSLSPSQARDPRLSHGFEFQAILTVAAFESCPRHRPKTSFKNTTACRPTMATPSVHTSHPPAASDIGSRASRSYATSPSQPLCATRPSRRLAPGRHHPCAMRRYTSVTLSLVLESCTPAALRVALSAYNMDR